MTRVQVRPADGARLVLGSALLVAPQSFISAVGSPSSVGVRRTTRVLGARYLVQAVAAPVLQRPWVRGADTAVDLVHAGSMLVFSRVFPNHRRLAHLSAVAAVCFAALDATERTPTAGRSETAGTGGPR